ncbi:hypothetical protein ACL598_16765 [Bordetella bronchialis]|uniref:hypothetical protein n=1 Tax=Bordetella bronchialis TaxID=463025 RepID=UPI003D073E7E
MANDFLPFGTGAGANVLDQAAYDALPARLAGFSSGTAKSIELNKVWRQSSFIASVLAQFIADATGEDVLDDGDSAGLEAKLRRAIAGYVATPVGASADAAMSLPSAAASATFSASQVCVGTSIGGSRFLLSNYSQSLNLTTTGAGGMDTGSAPTNGFVAIYAIYNPLTGTRSILAANATAAVAPEVYAGGNMPAGYTASALISVWGTNASGQLVIGTQVGRRIGFTDSVVLNTSTVQGTPTAITVPAIPRNAKTAGGSLIISAAVSGNLQLFVYDSDSNTGQRAIVVSSTGLRASFDGVCIKTPQTIRWSSANSGATSQNFQILLSNYTF